MYQNVVTVRNLDMSINNVIIESGMKKQITTRTKITRRNAIISK